MRNCRVIVRAAMLLLGTAFVVAETIGDAAEAQTTVDYAYFDRTLAAYGTWVVDPRWGRVWRPNRLPAGWRPYMYGRWAYTGDYGWMWVSDEPYGWVVYHYGHWVWSTKYGWVWLAGDEWAPAWVEWCYGGGYVGWAPAQPDFYWQGDYYYGAYDCTSPAFYSHAVFVHESYYGRRGMSSHVEPSSRNAVAARATVNVTSYSRGPSGVSNRSVDVAKLEAATGVKVESVSVTLTSKPVAGKADAANEIKIFRPSVAKASVPDLEARVPTQLNTELPTASPGEARPPDLLGSSSLHSPSRPPLDASTPTREPSFPSAGTSSFPSPGLGGSGTLGGVGGVLGR